MANLLLAYGLEHEALYTMLDSLKPMSSLGPVLSYPLAKKDWMADGYRHVVNPQADSIRIALKELDSWHRITKELSNEHLQFLVIPFRQPWDEKRHIQVLVCRKDQFRKTLQREALFFGQWGFTANADPATVLTAIEFESENDRYRAYGYLFGYPDYAVDFFVEASIAGEESGEFVTRDFFHIPVAAGDKGYFTYAIPKGYIPGKSDSMIYNRAWATLARYNQLKGQYEKKRSVGCLGIAFWSIEISPRFTLKITNKPFLKTSRFQFATMLRK
ncbi:MAG: hypothetical protein Roseis2KO_59440 [Roseivirga sp.]